MLIFTENFPEIRSPASMPVIRSRQPSDMLQIQHESILYEEVNRKRQGHRGNRSAPNVPQVLC